MAILWMICLLAEYRAETWLWEAVLDARTIQPRYAQCLLLTNVHKTASSCAKSVCMDRLWLMRARI